LIDRTSTITRNNEKEFTVAGKYVVLQTPDGERAFIIPGGDFFHDDVTRIYNSYEVLSAGFISIDKEGRVKCIGRSEGLNIASRGEDDEVLIKHQLKPESSHG
jgi:hypothetical protein